MDSSLAHAPEFFPFIGTLARQQQLRLQYQQQQQPAAATLPPQPGIVELVTDESNGTAGAAPPSTSPRLGSAAALEVGGGGGGGGFAPPSFQWLYTSYLGGGSYGKTWLAYEQATGNYAAVKIIPLHTDQRRELVIREIQLMTLASRHFSFPTLFQKETLADHALLFMEYCDAGDLHQEISRRVSVNVGFSEHHVRLIMVQLLIGVNHLHRQGYIHRDIKSANVLLSCRGTVKVGDFGLARMASVASTYCGTPEYMAPEIWAHGSYDCKIDVWALGVVLYEMLTLQRPFYGGELRDQILDNAFPRLSTFPHMASTFSAEIADTCEFMLTSDPERRPSIAQLLAQDYWRSAIDELCRAMSSSQGMAADMDRVYWCLMHDGLVDASAVNNNSNQNNHQQQATNPPSTNDPRGLTSMPLSRAHSPATDLTRFQPHTGADPELPLFPDMPEIDMDPGVASLQTSTRQAIDLVRGDTTNISVSPNTLRASIPQVRYLLPFLCECLMSEEARTRRVGIVEAFAEQRELLRLAEETARVAVRATAVPPPSSYVRSYVAVAADFATPTNNPFAARQLRPPYERAATLGAAPGPLTGRLMPRQLQPASSSSSLHSAGGSYVLQAPMPPPPQQPQPPDAGSKPAASVGNGRRVSSTLFR